MNTGGWIVMILSVASVTILFFWCIWKALTIPEETEKMHGFDFETPDALKEEEEDKS